MLAQTSKKTANKLVVRVPYVSEMCRESVHLLMVYIYSGKLDLCSSQVGSEVDTQRLVQLMSMARHFGLVQLERSLLSYIGSTLSTRNVVDMLDMGDGLNIAELREKCMRFIDEHSSELLAGPLRSPLCKLSASSLVTVLQRDSFCQREASVLRVVREWHAYNNVTQMDASVFSCVRLTAMDRDELGDLLVDLENEKPAVKEMVRLAFEATSNRSAARSKEMLVFEMSCDQRAVLRSPYRCAHVIEPDHDQEQCVIIRLGNEAPVNYVSVRDAATGDEKL